MQEEETGDAAAAAARAQPVTVVLPPWHARFRNQFTALFWKNVLVNWRNLRATLLRILAPFFFMLLLYLTDLAISADNPKQPYAVANLDPAVEAVTAIPACETGMYIRRGQCWDLFYTPNTSATAQALVRAMQAANPGRPIPDDKVLGFSTPDDVNSWLTANPERVLGGVHFSEQGDTQINFLLQVNTSVQYFKDKFQDPTFFAQVPLQVAAERAIAQYLANASASGAAPQYSWQVSTSMFAHPTTNSINAVGKSIGAFVFAANLFTFVLILASVVSERERGLRRALKTMGMLESAFWLSWLSVEVVAAVLFTLLLQGFGAAFGFSFFRVNSFGLVFVLFFVFQLSMVSVAFLLSTFLARSSAAITAGFVVFLVGWIVQSVVVFGFPWQPKYVSSVPVLTAIFTLLPWAPLAKACVDLGSASEDSSSPGISWGNRAAYCQDLRDGGTAVVVAGEYQDFDCVFNINQILWVLTAEFLLYFLLTIYLDHVLPDENGVRKGSLWYFLTPSYWRGSRRNALKSGSYRLRQPLARAATLPDAGVERDEDVAAEERRMQDLLQHRTGTGGALSMAGGAGSAVEVFGLQAVFAGRCCGGRGCSGACCFCCHRRGRSRRRTGEFWAVKGSWFAIESDRVFCLLGPNGAGKSTTLNLLTGVLPPSGGDALVYGESLSAPGGIDRIRSLMGVCPQFDVLWGELTGLEHLRLFGRMKGLPAADVARQAHDLLEGVRLTGAARMRTAAYSGGMRRRLSVAIALLGDPLLVYLDEPTTGMDPISRRHVWDIIEASKAGRAIVLTTHSMEEADILGDQVAIMARGRVRAIGSPLHLKQRFGSGYQLSVSVLPARSIAASDAEAVAVNTTAVRRLFKEELGLEPADETRAYLTYLVPKAQEGALPAFLAALDARRQLLGVTDVQISLTSLEEVFLAIARKAEVEAAAGDTVAAELPDGGTLQVPMGEEWATDPATGRNYFITWVHSDAGSLEVLKAEPVERRPGSGGLPASAVAPDGQHSPGSASASRSSVEGGDVAPRVVEMSRKDT